MTKGFVNEGDISLATMNVGKKNEIRTYNSLTYEGDDISITGRHEFTAYDRAVHNAVCSLFVSGNEVITPKMVYRTLNGMVNTENVNQTTEEKVRNSIDKSRFMRLRVDYEDEAKTRKWKIDKASINSNLLHADECMIEAGGEIQSAFKIIKTPILYEYAQYTKQIIAVPLELLDIRDDNKDADKINNTEDVITMKEYLLRRIEIMKHDKKQSKKIIYDTIFDETGIKIKHGTERDRHRNNIKKILSLWRDKYQYIENFAEYKEGRGFKGIEINF
jgi:hypothetical protein